MKSACMITLAVIGSTSAAPQRRRTKDIKRQLKPGDESKPAHADEEPYDPNLGMSTPIDVHGSMAVPTLYDGASMPAVDSSMPTDTDGSVTTKDASSAASAAFSGLVSAAVIVGAYAIA